MAIKVEKSWSNTSPFRATQEVKGEGSQAVTRWRVTGRGGAVFLLSYDELFDLTELLDEVCDAVEEAETDV